MSKKLFIFEVAVYWITISTPPPLHHHTLVLKKSRDELPTEFFSRNGQRWSVVIHLYFQIFVKFTRTPLPPPTDLKNECVYFNTSNSKRTNQKNEKMLSTVPTIPLPSPEPLPQMFLLAEQNSQWTFRTRKGITVYSDFDKEYIPQQVG